MSDIKNVLPLNSTVPARDPELVPDKRDTRDPKVLEAARGFENQFLRQMISEMRKTVPDDELLPESMADKIYREQLDGAYADKWVDQGGIGLADLIYDQLTESQRPTMPPKVSGEYLPVNQKGPSLKKAEALPRDLFNKADGNLFLAKKVDGGFLFKSRQALPEKISLHSPFSGLVLQSAALEDGRSMVVVRHDNGLVSQLVHTGHNHVKNGMKVGAGEILATLPASRQGEPANVFFGLRQAGKVE